MRTVSEGNLVPRAHVPFGQHRVLVLTKRHVGSGNEIVPVGIWSLTPFQNSKTQHITVI